MSGHKSVYTALLPSITEITSDIHLGRMKLCRRVVSAMTYEIM